MEVDTSNSNDQRTSLNFGISSKFGMADRRTTEANVNLDLSNHNLAIQFRDDDNTYILNVSFLKNNWGPNIITYFGNSSGARPGQEFLI